MNLKKENINSAHIATELTWFQNTFVNKKKKYR